MNPTAPSRELSQPKGCVYTRPKSTRTIWAHQTGSRGTRGERHEGNVITNANCVENGGREKTHNIETDSKKNNISNNRAENARKAEYARKVIAGA